MGSELDGTRSRKEEVVSEALGRLFPDENVPYESIAMVGIGNSTFQELWSSASIR